MAPESTTLATEPTFPESLLPMIAASRNARVNQDILWALCRMYVRGYQRWVVARNLGSDKIVVTPSQRNRKVINHTLPALRRVYAALSVSTPGISASPATSSVDDTIKARANEDAAMAHWYSTRFEDKLKKGINTLLTTGTIALHTLYDKATDRVEMEVVRPENLYVESGAINDEETSFMAVRTIVRRADCERKWPDLAEEIKRAPAYKRELVFQGVSTTGMTYQDERVELFDVYWKDGRRALSVGGAVYAIKTKRATTSIPIRVIRAFDVDDFYWGLGLIESILEAQDDYNIRRTQISDNATIMGNPPWLVAKSANVPSEAIVAKPGKIIRWSGTGPEPKQSQPAIMPDYVLQDARTTQAEIYDITGVHSTSLGKRPVGLASGEAIRAVMEGDTSQLQKTMDNIVSGVEGAMIDALELMRAYYNEPRSLRLFDGAGHWIYKAMQGSDLAENPEVIIEAGTFFKADRADREKRIIDKLTSGLITPDVALDDIDFGRGRQRADEYAAQLTDAQFLLQKVLEGNPIEVWVTDDPKAFVEVFKEYARTNEEYYRQTPEIRKVIRDVLLACAMPPDASANVTGLIYPRPPLPALPPPGTPGTPEPMPKGAAQPKNPVGRPAAGGAALSPPLSDIQPQALPDDGPDEAMLATSMGGTG